MDSDSSENRKEVQQQCIKIDQLCESIIDVNSRYDLLFSSIELEPLVLEVRRLREENEKLYADRSAFEKVYETHTNQLRAKLRRVEALPAKWRDLYESTGRDNEYLSCPVCAMELEDALEG